MTTGIITGEILDQIRNDTAGASHVIHFNNAGASLPPNVVIDSVTAYLREEAFCGGYEAEAKHQERIDGVYDSIAQLINANRDEVALFENASAAWGTAFKGITWKEGDEIITSEMEYVTNIIGLADIQKEIGIKVVVIPNDQDGNFSMQAFEESITANTRLIAVTHVSSSGSCILPVEQIGDVAERCGITYLVDACQSVGQLPVDVKRIKCDLLSATGRKYLRAPRGTGFLFVRKRAQDQLKPNLMDFVAAANVSLDGYTLRQDARRFELYEKSRALTLGLGEAVSYALALGMENIWQRIKWLSSTLRRLLDDIDGVVVNDKGANLSGIVTFSVSGLEAAAVKTALNKRGINVSVSFAQATPIYMDKNSLTAVVRASVHYYNTEQEIDELCKGIASLLNDN